MSLSACYHSAYKSTLSVLCNEPLSNSIHKAGSEGLCMVRGTRSRLLKAYSTSGRCNGMHLQLVYLASEDRIPTPRTLIY